MSSKIKPSDLRREAQELIGTGQMPTPEELLAVIAKVREKYSDKIKKAQQLPNDD